MSNCIQIHNNRVSFFNDEINWAEINKLWEEHNLHDYPFEIGDIFCWFLRNNIYFDDEEKGIEIRFGRGLSGHTWRDFRQTLWFLNEYIIKEKKHTFKIADEGDEYDSIEEVIVNFPYKTWEDLRKDV